MGSPISGLIAEIFLQQHENNIIKNILDTNNIRLHNRYDDDILIIYDNSRTNPIEISGYMNNIHPALQFKPTTEANNSIYFLDLTITRQHNKLTLNIYRKTTTTDTTIHYNSNHPTEHKTAAYRFLLNRAYQLPITQEQELSTIYQIARNNGFNKKTIDTLNAQITNKNNDNKTSKAHKKWITFEYHSPLIRKATNIFKNTDLRIAYRVSNTTQKLLQTHHHSNQDIYTNSGIYSLQCNTCNKQYVGQTGSNMTLRYSEHKRYIKSNEPKSAYALHILNKKHEYGTIQSTMKVLKTCKKGWKMNILENFYIQKHQQEGTLIQEQIPSDENLLFKIIIPPHSNAQARQDDDPQTRPYPK